ncbi:MAG: LysM peptidoglycan-binding domain-containing protein [Verrucomicrobiota bacterium]
MKTTTIEKLARKHHDSKRTAAKAFVYLLRNDGEICATQGGKKFLRMGLRVRRDGLGKTFGEFPERFEGTSHTYCIVGEKEAYQIRAAMEQEMMSPATEMPFHNMQITKRPFFINPLKPVFAALVSIAVLLILSVLANASDAHPYDFYTITVKRGETLSHLSYRHRFSVDELKEVNGLESSRILAGQKLRVPRLRRGLTAVGRIEVRYGDTLSLIALQFDIEPEELASHNGITDMSKIDKGDWLQIPGKHSGAVATESSSGSVNSTPKKPEKASSNRWSLPEVPPWQQNQNEEESGVNQDNDLSETDDSDQRPEYDEFIGISFPEEATIDDVALALGVSRERVEEWNPEYRATKGMIPKGTHVRVPSELAGDLEEL